MGHLEDSLSSQTLCQQKQDLGVETATAVHIPHHSGEHLLRSVDSKAEMGRCIYLNTNTKGFQEHHTAPPGGHQRQTLASAHRNISLPSPIQKRHREHSC